MKLYFAPLEGITGFVLRNAYESCFPNVIDKYFAPFLTASSRKFMSNHDKNDISPVHNEGICLVPQILTNKAEDFIHTAQAVCELGYREINLNLGCPSKTVVTKKKGAGLLAYPELLEPFLEAAFDWSEKSEVKLSIKTRLGMYEEDEFAQLLAIYNKYPLHELILHPRTQADYYKNPVRMEAFDAALANSRNPVCYNGDLSDLSKTKKFRKQYPNVDTLMIGRGFLMHPYFGAQLKGGEQSCDLSSREQMRSSLWQLHDRVYQGYQETIQGEKNVLFKMKELWTYLVQDFPQEDRTVVKAVKQIRKSEKKADYEIAVRPLRFL